MSTDFNNKPVIPDEWISQAEAARLRQISRQAIAKLVKKGRIASILIGGRTLVYRPDVEAFEPKKAGRHKKDDAE